MREDEAPKIHLANMNHEEALSPISPPKLLQIKTSIT